MVGPIAATAGGILIEKASDEDSIVNTAFKLTVLIGLFITIGVGIFLIYQLTSIFQDLTGTIDNILNPAGGGSIFGLAFTALITPTLFGSSSYLSRLRG